MCDLSDRHVTCPTRVKKAETTDGFPWIDSPTLSPSDILPWKIKNKTKQTDFISCSRQFYYLACTSPAAPILGYFSWNFNYVCKTETVSNKTRISTLT